MTATITIPIAIDFAAPKHGKSTGRCMVHITPEQAEDFERLRRRGAVSVVLVAEMPEAGR